MAQIKKLSGGGTPKTTYGKYTKDGVEYTVDDKFLNEISHYNTTVANALRSGRNISYNSNTNTVTGLSTDDISHLNEGQQKRIGKTGRPFEGRKMRRERDAVSALKNFTPTTQQDQTSERILDMSKRIALTVDDDGKIVNDAILDRAKARIDAILGHANWDYDTYKLSGTNFADKDAVSRYFTGRDYINNLKTNIANNNLSEQDKIVLKDFGIDLDVDEVKAEDKRDLKAAEKKYSDAGLNYNKHKDIFSVDDRGQITIADSNLRSLLGEENAWINQSFRDKYSSWADILSDDYFVIDGIVYKAGSDALKRNAKFNEFVEDNQISRGSSDLIRQFWNNDHVYSKLGGEGIYSPANGLYGKDITGYYVRNHNTNESPFVLEMVDENAGYDEYGRPLGSTKWFIDPRTKQRIDENNIPKRYKSFIDSVLAGTAQKSSKLEADKYYSGAYSNTPYAQSYAIGDGNYGLITAYGDPNSNAFAGLYYDPSTQSYMWRDTTSIGEEYPGKLEGGMQEYYWALPTEIGELISHNSSKINDDNFRESLRHLLRNQYLRDVNFRDEDIHDANLQNLMDNLHQWLSDRKLSNPTPEALANRGIAYRVVSEKEGGIIKAQKGAKIESTNKATAQTFQQFDSKQREAGKEKVISDKTDMTAADWTEVGALITDAASLVSTFVPVYGNAIGAGLGATSSLAQFGVDVARDGFDWGDFGMLAANLGLDAATLIPGIGTGAKAAKIGKALKNSKAAIKLFSKAANAAGVGSALYTAYDNLFNGDDWTISDLRILINGVRGFNNFRTTANPTKKGEIKDDANFSFKSKDADLGKEISITKKEYDQILSKPASQQKEELKTILSSKHKALTDDEAIKLAQKKLNLRSNQYNEEAHNLAEQLKEQSQDPTEVYNIPFNSSRPQGNWWNPKTWQFWKKGGIGELEFTPEDVPTTGWWGKRARYNKSVLNNPNSDRHNIYLPIYSNIWYTPFQDDGVAPILPDHNVVFRKKGGVIKAYNGLSISPYNLTGKTYEFGQAKTPWEIMLEKQLEGVTKPSSTIKEDFNRIKEGQTPQITTSLLTDRNYESNPITRYASSLGINTPETSKPSPTVNAKGREKSNILNRLGQVDWISPALNITDFIISAKAINKTNDAQRAAIRAGMLGSQKSMPTEHYPIFNDQGISRMADERIRQMRQFKPNSSDAGINMAQSLMVNDKVDAINRERDAQLSNLIDKFEANTLALKQQYANQRTAIADENRKNWALGEAQLHQIDAQEAGQRAQNWKQMLYQIRQDVSASQQLANQQDLAISQQEAQINFDTEINNKYYNQWKAADPNGTIYGDVHTYASTVDPTNYSTLKINAINSVKRLQDRSIWGLLFGNRKTLETTPTTPTTPARQQSVTSFNKKGGKIRSTDEQHYLDQQKEIAKSLRKLNDNIFKLFQKMMS